VSAERSLFQASIYADTRLTAEEIAAHLARAVRGSVTGAGGDTVTAQRIELDVAKHDSYLGRPERVDPDDSFLPRRRRARRRAFAVDAWR
jgi:hypothetical protein